MTLIARYLARLRLFAFLYLVFVLAGCSEPPGQIDPNWQTPDKVFDIDLFEQNINDAIIGAYGYAYAINQDGQLYSEGAEGFSRGIVDATPELPSKKLSATQRMNIASISKTITAVAVLQLLDQKGLTIDDSILPYLPLQWDPHSSIADLTFRELLTHTSGLNGNANGAYRYADLRQYIETGISPSDKSQNRIYQNANYALFRVIIPYLWHGAFKLTGDTSEDGYAKGLAAIYIDYVNRNIFQPAGIATASCTSTDQDNPTLFYEYASPDDVTGWNPGDWTLLCGSGGWYLSARELAAFLAHLRYGELLSDEMRQLMDEEFLGWRPLGNVTGEHGIYRAHGGGLCNPSCSGGKGMSGAIMNFPNNVQVVLLINSLGGVHPEKYTLLRDAYDAAWVVP